MPIINPTEDQLNEWLSQQTMRGTIRGNRLADIALSQSQLQDMQRDNANGGDPGVRFAAQPMNTIVNNSTGRVIDMNYATKPLRELTAKDQEAAIVATGGPRTKWDVHLDGPREISRRQLSDGTTEVIKEVPTLDGFGRQSSRIIREIETPDYLNPAALKNLDYQTKLANLQKIQAEARGGGKPQLVDGQWVFPPSQDAPTGKAIPVEGFNKLGKALPSPAVKDLSAAGAAVEDSSRLQRTFKPEYGGNTILGDMSNTLKRVFGDETGQAQWWQDMDALQNQTRHNLFGSALTATELKAWEKTSITPRMNPTQIEQNLSRRQEIEARAASKLARAYTAAGYNKDQINELLGTASEYINQPAPPVGDVAQSNGSNSVTLPNGKTYTFPSGAAAEAFRRKAGL